MRKLRYHQKITYLQLQFNKERSFIKMLKSKSPRADPCGIPIEICFDELYVEPILTLYVRFVK